VHPFSTSNASVEATLDVETIVGNAPGTHLYIYLIPELSDQDIEDDRHRLDAIVRVLGRRVTLRHGRRRRCGASRSHNAASYG
jgi:hypothetical protein